MAINKFVSTRNRNKNRNRLIPLMGGLDDGSTLSLDFTTMSSLDSRFTFSRSSPATFINFSGLVKYAAHELYLNTQFTGLDTTPSQGWGFAFNTGGGSILFDEDTGEVTIDAISGRRGISRTSSTTGTSGRKMIASVDVFITAGSLNPSDLIQEGSATNKQWYIDSTLYTSGTVPLDTPVTISLVFDSAANTNVYFGIGMNNTTSGTATFKNPRMQFYSGTLPAPVVGNTSTSASKLDTPRFDYNPTTLAPRGLLIEGSVVNIFPYSNAMTGGQYEYGVANSLTTTFNNTETASPDGSNNSVKVVKASSGQTYTFVRNQVTPQTSGVRTGSVWVKKTATSGSRYVGLRLTGAGFLPATPDKHLLFDLDTGTVVTGLTGNGYYTNPTIVAYPNGWYRISITSGTMSTGSGAAYLSVCMSTTLADGSEYNTLPAGTGFYMFGPQVEAGSGASSYIPTGSSTVQRAADDCTMQGANFTSWYVSTNPMTLLVDAEIRSSSGFPALMRLGENAGGHGVEYYYVGTTTATIYSKISASTNTELTMDSGVAFGTRQVLGYAIQTGSGLRSRNGATLSASNPVAFPTNTLQRLGIGSSGSATNYANAHIRRIKYWPVALPQPTLNQATTQ